MLNVIINNESVKTSYKKSQRILSKYLPQYGQRTYCGSISKEGLENLYNELKQISSRYMSISCLLIKNKHNTELIWIIGNKDVFDNENGVYALKSRTKKISYDYVENNREKFFNNLVKVSALFHDLGKANKDFQNKLLKIIQSQKNGTILDSLDISEVFRHETVSLFILYYFFEYIVSIKNDTFSFNESNILEAFEYAFEKIESSIQTLSFENITKLYNQILKNALNEIKELNSCFKLQNEKKQRFGIKSQEKKDIDKFKLIKISIYWLVLTHHRLIGFKKIPDNYYSKRYEDFFIEEQFINQYDITDKKIKTILEKKIIDNFSFSSSMPINNELWKKQVVLDLNELFFINEMSSEDFIENEGCNYLSLLSHYCRPFLVFSDYLGSVVKTKKDENLCYKNNDYNSHTFANLDNNDLGDTLSSHLIIVRKSFLNIKYLYNAFKQSKIYFPKLEKFDTKKLNNLIEQSTIEKFAWQNEAYYKILQENKEENHNFSVIISETGSGKTLGGVKVMKAVSKHKLRFNLCLGLRTLTLQSGTSYREELGLNDSQLGVIIGSDLSKKLYQKNIKNLSGSDVLNESEDVVFDFKPDNEWQKRLEIKNSLYGVNKLFEDNSFNIIESPIVVCTVDQLIGITNLNKVSKARLIPRIFSSDLILDEIDNYNPQDLNHIAKLIYLFGFYGRKVIIMSATVSTVIIESLYKAYTEGCKVFNYMNKKENKINLNLVSNLTDTIVKEYLLSESIQSELINFTSNFIEAQQKKPAKTKLRNIININKENWKNEIYKEINILHNAFKENIKINNMNINLSIGFIKFNSVDSARKMAYKLLTESNEELNLSENKKISVLCYHSKYLPIELDNIEKSLKTIINRKNLDFKNSPILKNIVNKNFNNSSKDNNLTIIICTTSILEVGRDHDYDWCIVEPTTNRSIIQTVGRVLRHRTNEKAEDRVSILSTMIKEKELIKASELWRNSGVYNYIPSFKLYYEDYKQKEDKLVFSTMFDLEEYNKNIYSSIMFRNNSKNTMKVLEDQTFIYNLKEYEKSIEKYVTNQWLNNYHYFFNSFRKNEKSGEKGFVKLFDSYYLKEASQVKYLFSNEFFFSSELENSNWTQISVKNLQEYKERIFLQKYLLEDLLKDYNNFTNNEINNLCLYEIEYFNQNKDIYDILDYHPLLGFNYKKLTS